MNLDKLPARYSKMDDDPNIIGSDEAAVKLARAGANKGGKPGALMVDGQAELDKVIVRPGFLRWKKNEPMLNLKAMAAGAKDLKTKDLMQSLAARHMQKLEKRVDRRQKTAEFSAKKPVVDSGATKMTPLNGYYYGLGDEVTAGDSPAATKPAAGGMDMKKLLCCAACVAGGMVAMYFLAKKGIVKV